MSSSSCIDSASLGEMINSVSLSIRCRTGNKEKRFVEEGNKYYPKLGMQSIGNCIPTCIKVVKLYNVTSSIILQRP
jgi:hypothetical protein